MNNEKMVNKMAAEYCEDYAVMCRDKYYKENLTLIRVSVPVAALYEQLADEASAVTQAALKMARSIRGENPPSDENTRLDILSHLQEEIMDLMLCCDVVCLDQNEHIAKIKAQRWVNFLKERGLLAM